MLERKPFEANTTMQVDPAWAELIPMERNLYVTIGKHVFLVVGWQETVNGTEHVFTLDLMLEGEHGTTKQNKT